MKLSEINAVIIGAGKISYSLADSMFNNGIRIVSIISRNKKSAQLLSRKYKVNNYSDKIKDIPTSANFFIFSVPDNQIEKTAKEISKLKFDFKNCIFIHLSGVETASVLSSIKQKGGLAASLHIMQTFPSKKIINLSGSYSAIESSDLKTKNLLFSFSKKIKLKPFSISTEAKILYHLAGVYASNFLVGNFFIAEKLFTVSTGMENFYKIIQPIVDTTIKNVRKNGAVTSLSGPVERGDKQTVLKHITAFDLLEKKSRNKNEIRLMKQNYISQSLTLINLIKDRDSGLSHKHIEVKNILLRHQRM